MHLTRNALVLYGAILAVMSSVYKLHHDLLCCEHPSKVAPLALIHFLHFLCEFLRSLKVFLRGMALSLQKYAFDKSVMTK